MLDEVKKGRARLAAAHRLVYRYKFDLEQLAFFAERLPEKDVGIVASHEHQFQTSGPILDEFTYPIEDMGNMVRAIHESTCPECGREGYLIRSERVRLERYKGSHEPMGGDNWSADWIYDYLPDWIAEGWISTVQCLKGHCYTAEPTLHDWVAYKDTPEKMKYG